MFVSHISLWLTFLIAVWGWCRYHFLDFSRLNFSHNFQWTILATFPCLLLYSFWASFEHLLMIWLIFFACLTTHRTKSWINTFINVVFHLVCSYSLFLCRVYQATVCVFKSQFHFQSQDYSLSVPPGISLINCLYIFSSLQFSTLFSFTNFSKSFSETVSTNFIILTCFTPWRKFHWNF